MDTPVVKQMSWTSVEEDWGLKRRSTFKLVLWVRDEPFEMGCLPITPCSKMSLPILKKILKYVREKDLLPDLTLSKWQHICKYKLLIDGQGLGWIYMRIYDVLFQQMERAEPEDVFWDRRCHQQLGAKERDLKQEFKVPTLKFLLFLYLQHSFRLIRRMNSVSTTLDALNTTDDEAYTTDNQSEGDRYADSRDKSTRKIISEQLQYELVLAQIQEIIEFLEYDAPKSAQGDPRMKFEVIEALNLILCGTLTPNTSSNIRNIEHFIQLQEHADSVEFDAETLTLNRRKFVAWIRKYLRINPWGSGTSVLKCPLIKIVSGIMHDGDAPYSNRISCNNQEYPHCWYIISNVQNQVIFIKDIPKYASVRIDHCDNSFIYLPGLFTCVSVRKCKDTTLFLGCVRKLLRALTCTDLIVYGQVRQIVVCDCSATQLHVHTACPPILAGYKNDVTLAPYTTFYPSLRKHMIQSRFGINHSLWNLPLSVGYDGQISGLPQWQWQLLDFHKTYQFVFPFAMSGRTTENPVTLPEDYVEFLNRRKEKSSEKWIAKAEEMDFTKEQLEFFKCIMFTRFMNWLYQTGLDTELVGLKSYQETLYSKGRRPVFARQRLPSDTVPSSIIDVLKLIPFGIHPHKLSFFN